MATGTFARLIPQMSLFNYYYLRGCCWFILQFEHCDANEELARITDDRMAGLGIQPRSNVQSPAGVRPQSDMSRSTEVTDV